MVGTLGIEPRTITLKGCCSTDWATFPWWLLWRDYMKKKLFVYSIFRHVIWPKGGNMVSLYSNYLFMRRLFSLIPLLALIPMSVSAYTVSCGSISEATGCSQCFRFELASSNAANNFFIPRTGIPAGQQEFIDLTKSTISGYTYQGSNVSPVGNITSNFDRFESGPNATASWIWAKTKTGQGILRNTLPATIDYNRPLYGIKYTTASYLKNGSSVIPGSEITQTSCWFFYVTAPVVVPPSAVCGNGLREGAEQCDDGNTNNNDGCSNSCRTPVCGNGTREWIEECDDGNTRNGDSCTSQCRNPGVSSICGNGIREGGEDCDDGNTSNTDLCSTSCRVLGWANPQCRVQAFDAYGSVPLTTTLSCSGEPRGRTVIIITKNNTLVDTSEVSSKTFTFNQSGRYTIRCYPDAGGNQNNSCTTVINVDGQCGNGLVERGEMCDDGNTISGDSCDRSCRLTGSTCGNGLLEGGEDCDDGNNSNNDTCSNICQGGTPDTGPMGMISMLVAIALGSTALIYFRRRQS
jgi:cysteine-rich repeat protein